MKTKKLGGSVVFSFDARLCPWKADPEKYVIEITGEIMTWAKGDEPDEKAGQIKIAVIKLSEARSNGVKLYYVLDSYDIEEVYPHLFKKDGVFLPDLPLEAPYSDLLLIEDVQLEPRFEKTDLRNQAIETAIASFASAGIVLVKKNVLGLEEIAALELGYWDLLFEDYFLRDNFRQNT
jgi:hypothetical protein